MKNKNIYLMYAITFLQGMVIYATISTLYRESRGIGIAQIALIESFSYIFTIVMEIPFGFIADRIGYKKTLVYSNLIYFISKIVFYYAYGFNMFLLERFFLSCAIAGLSGVDSSILYLSTDEENSHKVFSLFSGFGTGGMLFGTAIFTIFLSNNYKGCALATVITYGLAFVLSLFISEVKDNVKQEKTTFNKLLNTMKITLKDTKFIIFLFGVSIISQTTWNVSVMLNQDKYISLGLSKQGLGIIGMIISIAGMLGIYSASFKNKIGFKKFVYGLSILLGMCYLIMGYTKMLWVCFIADLLIDVSYSMLMPLFTNLENKRVSVSDRASQLSCYAIIIDLGCMVVSYLSSMVAKISNTAVFMMCFLLMILATASIYICYKE